MTIKPSNAFTFSGVDAILGRALNHSVLSKRRSIPETSKIIFCNLTQNSSHDPA